MKLLTNLLRTHDEEVEQYFFRKLQEPLATSGSKRK